MSDEGVKEVSQDKEIKREYEGYIQDFFKDYEKSLNQFGANRTLVKDLCVTTLGAWENVLLEDIEEYNDNYRLFGFIAYLSNFKIDQKGKPVHKEELVDNIEYLETTEFRRVRITRFIDLLQPLPLTGTDTILIDITFEISNNDSPTLIYKCPAELFNKATIQNHDVIATVVYTGNITANDNVVLNDETLPISSMQKFPDITKKVNELNFKPFFGEIYENNR